jgi:hypothetical protein
MKINWAVEGNLLLLSDVNKRASQTLREREREREREFGDG